MMYMNMLSRINYIRGDLMRKNRVYNFAAGPATLPYEVLKEAQEEMTNYHNLGMSVMEMSHRSKTFQEIIDSCEDDLRKLLHIPSNYKVLFMQGGATTQFSIIPLHLLEHCAGFINTGHWSKKALEEAKKYGSVKILASSEEDNFSYIPNCDNLDVSDCDYVYYCDNNTIYGTKFKEVPNAKGKTLVCDMSSSILSETIDVSKYGIIFAGAQKNIGPAGVTIVIIREDLIQKCNPLTPVLLRYKVIADSKSLYNTPPTYNIYMCGKVFKYLLKNGGVEAIEKINKQKAELLYDYFDSQTFYKTIASKESRSLMNVCFKTCSDALDEKFVLEASKRGLVNLKGHKVLKGLRASIYNAMPIEGVKALIKFMEEFKEENECTK